MDKEEAIRIIEMHCKSSGAVLRQACAMFIPELNECDSEKVRKGLLDYFRNWSEDSIFAALPVKSIVAWLKQKPWTEEDDRRVSSLKGALACRKEKYPVTTDVKGDSEWLDGLKDRFDSQPHWRPTEEQMKALDMGIREVWTQQNSDLLMSLYKDLKKLQG